MGKSTVLKTFKNYSKAEVKKTVPPQVKVLSYIADSAYKAKGERPVEIAGLKYDPDISTHDISVYKNDRRAVIAYRGTREAKDLIPDAHILLGDVKKSNRYKDDTEDTKRILEKLDNRRITITGSSLGGAIAQAISHKFGIHAETFNPGSSPLGSEEQCKGCKAHIIKGDVISNWNLEKPSEQVHVYEKRGLDPHPAKNFDADHPNDSVKRSDVVVEAPKSGSGKMSREEIIRKLEKLTKRISGGLAMPDMNSRIESDLKKIKLKKVNKSIVAEKAGLDSVKELDAEVIKGEKEAGNLDAKIVGGAADLKGAAKKIYELIAGGKEKNAIAKAKKLSDKMRPKIMKALVDISQNATEMSPERKALLGRVVNEIDKDMSGGIIGGARSEVSSVIFDKDKFTAAQANKWIKEHGFTRQKKMWTTAEKRHVKVKDVPKKGTEFRNKKISDGIDLVLAFPKNTDSKLSDTPVADASAGGIPFSKPKKEKPKPKPQEPPEEVKNLANSIMYMYGNINRGNKKYTQKEKYYLINKANKKIVKKIEDESIPRQVVAKTFEYLIKNKELGHKNVTPGQLPTRVEDYPVWYPKELLMDRELLDKPKPDPKLNILYKKSPYL